MNLGGWHLTDQASQLTQWRFPDTNLAPNAFLIVFASGKNRRTAGAPLHTNFRLGGDGEYLALVAPDGTNVVSAYAPAFPEQVAGVSYGIPVQQMTSALVASGATARVWVPSDGSLGTAWTGIGFDDSTWLNLPTGIGYETDGEIPFISTTLARSVEEFSGSQGQNNWSYGYWARKNDADGVYASAEFVPFPNADGSFSTSNFWTGSRWDWFNGDPPYTELTSQGGWPAGENGISVLPEHWAIRRYVCESNGPITVTGTLTHTSDWVYVTATGISITSLIYIYLTGLGEGYIDDIRVVAGILPASGPNLLSNGDFEAPNLNPWTVSPNLAGSSLTTAASRSGSRSLHLVSTAGGATQSSAIWQTLSPALNSGQVYSLSYWYLPATNSSPLVVRFSGGWIDTTPIYCGDGTIVRIFVDGTEVLSRAAFVSSEDYSVTVPAQAGSQVDFVIDPGPASNDSCDATLFTARVDTADPAIAVVADSVADWSVGGRQGEKNWFYGYFNAGSNVPPRTYRATNFVAFPRADGPPGTNNFWDGASWDWFNGDPPFDEIGERVMNPNGLNSGDQHWVIRRWISEVKGKVTVDWTVIKLLAGGGGVTARVLHNGVEKDALTLPGTNASVITRSVAITGVQLGDAIDIALDPSGVGMTYGDGSDRSFVSAVIRGSPGLSQQINGNVQTAMSGVNATAYLRLPFQVDDPSAIQFLTLRMKHDDGFVAYLNGVPVAQANAPALPDWNSNATMERSDADANDYVEFNLTSAAGLLQMGDNVLAIQGLNAGAGDSDFLALPELVAARVTLDPSAKRYFAIATPGGVNGFGSSGLGPLITAVSHTPALPGDEDDLFVSATLRPTLHAIQSVYLIYRVMYGGEVRAIMFDDGLHADGAAGDGTFGGAIPASASTRGQMVRYYVFAQDALTNGSRFPSFADPQNSPEYSGTVVSDPLFTNALSVLHMFVRNPELATNYTGTRCSLFYDGEFYDNVGVNLHGQTTAAVFDKRSFDIDLNAGHRFRWSREAAPVDDFNLITTAPDKAYVRHLLAWETFNAAGVPSHFAFPLRLQQNGALYGVMHFVEKGDSDFLERVGLDPKGALYKIYLPLENAYGGVAEKKSRRHEDNADLQALIDGCKLAGQARRQYLYDHIDIPEVINFLATLQLVQNEDCCFFKNYYLYRDSEGTGEWQMQPWDLDLTFGRTFTPWIQVGPEVMGGYYDTNIYWTNRYYTQIRSPPDFIGVGQPLVDAMLGTPELFEMFLRRWSNVHEDLLQPTNTHPLLLRFDRRIDELAALISADAAPDLAQWGTFPPVQTLSVAVDVLKREYFARRRSWVFDTLRFANGGPYLGTQPTNAVVHFGAIEFNPASGDQAQEYLVITNANSYAVEISDWQLSGAIDFTFRPGTVLPPRGALYLSPDVNAFRARTSGPRRGQSLFVQGNYQGQLSARGEMLQLWDKNGRLVRATNYTGNASLAQQYLRITEIMYRPTPPPPGQVADTEEFEYIELKNIGPATLSLEGVRLVNGVEFDFTDSSVTSLGPGQTVLVLRNLAAFTSRYGSNLNIAGQYVGLLDNAGENIRLEDAASEKILDFDYDNAWYPITDGFGFSLVIVDENAPWDTWNLQTSWQPSGAVLGSPGRLGPPPPVVPAVVINEVLTHSDLPAVDAIELYNSGVAPANISGWFITDDFRTPKKFRIQDGTILPPADYMVFTETSFNPINPPSSTAFSFGSDGDEAYLFSADTNGNLTGYFHGFAFGAAESAVPFGRHFTSIGAEHFVAQSASSLGMSNVAPKVGPVVISEIAYRPPDLPGAADNANDEFIEIQNIAPTSVALFDPLFPNNTWRLRGGITLNFPSGVTLNANGVLVVVNFDPADTMRLANFRSRFGVPAAVQIVGPYAGMLGNSADDVRLLRPDAPVPGEAPYIVVDEVEYSDSEPWPHLADGTGASLQRRNSGLYGNDPIHWTAAAPTAGRIIAGGNIPVITVQPANTSAAALGEACIASDSHWSNTTSLSMALQRSERCWRHQRRACVAEPATGSGRQLQRHRVQPRGIRGKFQCDTDRAARSLLCSESAEPGRSPRDQRNLRRSRGERQTHSLSVAHERRQPRRRDQRIPHDHQCRLRPQRRVCRIGHGQHRHYLQHACDLGALD